MPKHQALPPLAELMDAFEYDPDTGLFVHARCKCGRALKGAPAGFDIHGYVHIATNDYLQGASNGLGVGTGKDPGHLQVDHIDRDRSNNRASNLRLATAQQNRLNTEIKGYTKIRNKYRAQRWVDGHMIHLGMYDTPEAATAAYQELDFM